MKKVISRLYKLLWKGTWKKKGVVVLLVGLVVAGAVYLGNKSNGKDQYKLEAVSRDTITELVSETGNVTSTGAVPVYSTTTGLVEEVLVGNGDYVEKDTPLFKVVSTATKQEKDTALSNYITAKTAYETAKATQLSLQASMFGAWDTFKELAESDEYEDGDGNPRYAERGVAEFHVPEKQWLAAEASYKKQELAVKQAAVSMAAAWEGYQATQDSEVVAVIGGQVRNLGIAAGDAVRAPTSLTLSSTPTVLVLFSPEARTLIKVDVAETDAIKVESGQPVSIEFDALPHEYFKGHVDRVDSLTTPSGGVVKYAVYVELDDEVEGLKGGMTADVDITVATKENVLTVPSSAVKPYEGGRAVRVVGEDGEIEYVPVVTGSRGDGRTEIESGIDEGVEVIVALKNEQVEKSSPSLF